MRYIDLTQCTSVPYGNTSMIRSVDDLEILVPSALYEQFIGAAYWSNYAEKIRAIEDYPDITEG